MEIRDEPRAATVVLRPSWISRLFGARDRVVELVYDRYRDRWSSARTGRALRDIAYGSLIIDALEVTPVDAIQVPQAIALRSKR